MARLLGRMVHAYQVMTDGRPSPCRYVPSCSSYAAEVLETHGALRGGSMAVRRICRCHPWSSSGWDPVPDASGHQAPEPQLGDSQPSAIPRSRNDVKPDA